MVQCRRFISALLAAVMIFGMVPTWGLAAETEMLPRETVVVTETTAVKETVSETETTAVMEAASAEPEEEYAEYSEVVLSDAELPENNELYNAYLERMFYGNEIAFFGVAAREQLTQIEQQFYDYMKAEILLIAAGERTSTRIEIQKDLMVRWGMTVSFDVSGADTTSEKAGIVHSGIFDQINQRNIINALMYDCPYEMYWYDKTVGTLISSGCSLSGDTGIVTRVIFNFRVVGDMQPDDYDATNPTMDTTFVATAQAAAGKARSIAETYAACSDYEKLVAYKDEICALTSYNSAAASSSTYTTDADPWQLIYVFDGDSSTKVVCEGYSKAFQYLFDLSSFSGDVESRIVVGALNGGGHMWNVVSIGGKNYIADVTNSDSGTAGQNGGLFLSGGSGTVAEGYIFLGHSFTYSENTIALWGEENLVIEAEDYVPCDHVEETLSGVAATCTEPGLTEGKRCSVCGEVIAAQTQIPALGHSYENIVTVPTCTVDGWITYTCMTCGDSYAETIAASGHEEVIVPAVEPSCEETGLTEGRYCAVCDELLAVQEEVAALGHSFVNGFCNACGDYEPATWNSGIYEISNAGQLYWFAARVNGGETDMKAVLAGDIVVNESLEGSAELRHWVPIGSEEMPYRGSFNGKGYSISGLFLNNNSSYVGLFGSLENAMVFNVTLLNSKFYGSSVVGGIAGNNSGGTISECISAAHCGGDFSSVGGIVGVNCNGTIVNCENFGNTSSAYIMGECIGGIAGQNVGENGGQAIIRNCLNSGNCSAYTNVGGIAGENIGNAVIEKCNNAGSISTSGIQMARGYNGGGIAGTNDEAALISCCGNLGKVDGEGSNGGITGSNSGRIEDCWNTAEVRSVQCYSETIEAGGIAGINRGTIENCFAACLTMAPEGYFGALVGYDKGGVIINSYFDSTWIDNGIGGGAEDYTEQTAGAMPHDAFVSGEVAWLLNNGNTDENAVWRQNLGTDTYPGFSGNIIYRNQLAGCQEGNIVYGYANAQEEVIISHAGGKPVKENEILPDCLNTGSYDSVVYCAACGEELSRETVAVDALGHDYVYGICQRCGDTIKATYEIYAGKSLTLKEINPATGKAYTSSQLTWSMSDEFAPFATVTRTGKITARKVVEKTRIEVVGTITATREQITYLIDIYPAVTQLEVKENGEIVNSKTILMDLADESLTLTADAFPLDTLENITWTVSDAKKAYAEYTIDGDKLTITNPRKAGTVTVKAVIDAGVKKTVTVKVQIGSFAKEVKIETPEKTTLRGGETMTLTAAITDPENVTKPGIVWTSSNKLAATVSSAGKVTAKAVAHPTTVTITATSKDGQAKASIDLEIIPKNEGQLVLMENGAFVTNTTKAMNYGDTCQISVYSIVNGESVAETVTWTSSKETVAYVADGQITAAGVGTAKITATAADGRKAVINVKVSTLVDAMTITTKDGKNLDADGNVVVASGKTVTLVANILTQGANKAVTWEIAEGAEYAKVASGKVTATKDLTSVQYITVKATAKDGSGVSATIRVKILPLATGVQIYQNGTRVRSNTTYIHDMLASDTIKLSAKVFPAKANQTLTLTSSNKKIADFNENGELICYKTGTVTITATAQDGSNAKTTFKLTVVKKVQSLTLKDNLPVDKDGNLYVSGGKSLKLAPMVQISPSDATNKKLTWSVAPNDLGVKISSTGVLTTKKVTKPETVNIMVTTNDGSGCMLSFNVTVYPE